MLRNCIHTFAILSILLLGSCASRKLSYFNRDTREDSAIQVQDMRAQEEVRVHPDDILAISVSSTTFMSETNPSRVFTDAGINYNAAGAPTTNTSFLVDKEGSIDYPLVGKVKVGGLTMREVKEIMASRLKDYLKQPIIEARIVNYRVTVLGEVGHEGIINAPNQKMTVIDAISLSGGIPLTGKKDNVLVIRENGNKREYARIDLTSKELFNSPYYYLKQNDILMVEPSSIRRQETNTFIRIYLPTFTTVLSTLISVYAFIQISKGN